MEERNIQEKFLLDLCEQETCEQGLQAKKRPQVSVFLASGIQLRGSIVGFDAFVVLLKKGDVTQMIYKHAISTIVSNLAQGSE